MDINLNSSEIIKLNTAGKICEEDINIKPRLQNKTVTTNGIVTPDEGYAGLSEVNVNVITSSGTTQITSNGSHDIAAYATAEVNVPIPEGYIKPSGTILIASNEYYDVAKYATAKVNVPIPEGYIKPSGTISITSNGYYDVAKYTKANVNVIVDSIGVDTSDATATASDIAKGKIAYTADGYTVGTAPMIVMSTTNDTYVYIAIQNWDACCVIIKTNQGVYSMPLIGMNDGISLTMYIDTSKSKYFSITGKYLSKTIAKFTLGSNITIQKWGIGLWQS